MSSITELESIFLCNTHADWYDLDAPASPAYLIGYDGAIPANAGTALSGNDVVVAIPLASTAFGAGGAGGSGAQATAAGSPTGYGQKVSSISFIRVFRGDGTVGLQEDDISVSGGGGKIQLSSTSVTAIGQLFTLTSLVLEQPKEVA